MKVIYALVLCLLFGGCTIFSKTAREEKRERKDQKALDKIAAKPERKAMMANKCLELYPPAPPTTITDSSAYKEWKLRYDSIVATIPEDYNYDTVYLLLPDSLKIERLEEDLKECAKQAKEKENTIRELNKIIAIMPSVRDTILRVDYRQMDSAIATHQKQIFEKDKIIADKDNKIRDLEKKLERKKGQFNTAILAASAILILTFLFVYLLVRKLLKKATQNSSSKT